MDIICAQNEIKKVAFDRIWPAISTSLKMHGLSCHGSIFVILVMVFQSYTICLASDGDEIDNTGCPKGKNMDSYSNSFISKDNGLLNV